MALLDRVLADAQPEPADAEWFDANYPEHRKELYGLINYLSDGRQHVTEEVEHLVAIKAWLRGRVSVTSDVRAWLRTTANNTFKDFTTSEKRRPSALSPEMIEQEYDSSYEPAQEEDEPFEQFGHLLTDQEKRVATLLFVRGLKQAEAGAALGVTESTIGNTIAHIKAKIRDSKEGVEISASSTRLVSRGERDRFWDAEDRDFVNLRRNETEPADLRDQWDGPDFPVAVRKL